MATLLLCGCLWAQGNEAAALKHGQLVVWVVHPTVAAPPGPREYGGAARSAPGYAEQTSGSFGQPASDYGTAASNTGVATTSPLIGRTGAVPANVAPADRDAAAAAAAGYHEQTSGSFGQPSSDYGTAASNHGQNASTLGETASNYGTNASNYGQTASTLGQTASSYGVSGSGQPNSTPVAAPRGLVELVGPKLRAAYPGLAMRYASVDAGKLAADLKQVAGSPAYPDVLVFEGFPATWTGPTESVQRLAKEIVGGSAPLAARDARGRQAARQCVVLNRAPHKATALAYAEYLDNEGVLRMAPSTR
jgi:hypothetical protein